MEYTEPNISFTYAFYSSEEQKRREMSVEADLFYRIVDPFKNQPVHYRRGVFFVGFFFVFWWTHFYPYACAYCANKSLKLHLRTVETVNTNINSYFMFVT